MKRSRGRRSITPATELKPLLGLAVGGAKRKKRELR
jgi:hypothetical protein